MRWWALILVLGLAFCGVLGGATYVYLRFGWFESDVLGQTLQLKRIHQEGLSYRPKRPWDFSRVRKGSYVSLAPTTPSRHS